MKNNPFISKTFKSVWSKHFNGSKQGFVFNFMKDVTFVKKKHFPLYFNVGKNITNGMYYNVDKSQNDFRGKAFLLYDIPTYFSLEDPSFNTLKCIKVRQYNGFLANLKDFESYDDFAKKQFKANSRYKYRRNIKRLETCFDIDYKIYCGHISKEEYENICLFFKNNLSRRFDSLGLDNNIVSKWDYYYDLMYNMILSKQGVLTAIYSNGKPIGVSFSFLSKRVMLYAITSFDIDYMRYNLGHIIIIKLMSWCFDNGYHTYDFSKGQYEYKDRWTNHSYHYECHVLYDSKSIKASIIAIFISRYFKLKQFLRDKNVNRLYTKLKFQLKKKEAFSTKYFKVSMIENMKFLKSSDAIVNIEDVKYDSVRLALYNYLYLKPEKAKNIKIYEKEKIYYAICQNSQLKIYKE